MADLRETSYDKISLAHSSLPEIEANLDKINTYEPVIATDTDELVYKGEDGTLKLIGGSKALIEPTIDSLTKSTKYVIGDVVEVLGYYTKGDGANHYRIASATDDGSGILGTNGLWWNIVHNGEVNVSWLGSKGDGITDDTIAIQRALDFADVTIIPNKVFIVSTLRLDKVLQVLIGESRFNSNLKFTSAKALSIQNEGIKINNIRFDHIDNTTLNSNILFEDDRPFKDTRSDFDFLLKNCDIHKFAKIGTIKGRGLEVEGCFFYEMFGDMFVFDYPEEADFWGLDQIGHKYSESRRGFWFRNNRFHFFKSTANTTLIKNIKEYPLLTNLTLEGNTFEAGLPKIVDGAYNELNYVNNIHIIPYSGQVSVFDFTNLYNSHIEFESSNRVFTEENKSKYNINRIVSIKNESTDNIINIKTDAIKSDVLRTQSGATLKNCVIDIAVGEYTTSTDPCFSNYGSLDNCDITIVSSRDDKKCLFTNDPILSNNSLNFVTKKESEVSNDRQITELYGCTFLTKPSDNYIIKTKRQINFVTVQNHTKSKNIINYIGGALTSSVQISNYSITLQNTGGLIDTGDRCEISYGYLDLDKIRGLNGINYEYDTLKQLDTPYYTEKMKQEGIYDDFVDYMDSLNTNPLTRPSEPQPSERLLEFAKRYNIV